VPKKLKPETQAEQSARFKRDAQKLIDAGDLSPIDADIVMDSLVRSQRKAASSPRPVDDQ
jgi:hypothetical protein